jgi:hypothetical protein
MMRVAQRYPCTGLGCMGDVNGFEFVGCLLGDGCRLDATENLIDSIRSLFMRFVAASEETVNAEDVMQV